VIRYAHLFRKSLNRLRRRLSSDGGSFGQKKDARLGSRCMSQRETYPRRTSLSDENQDAVSSALLF